MPAAMISLSHSSIWKDFRSQDASRRMRDVRRPDTLLHPKISSEDLQRRASRCAEVSMG